MAFCAVVDACALYPFSLRDTLLRLGSAELYDPVWSAEILDEVTRNLVERGVATSEQAARLADEMQRAFPDAEVPHERIEALKPAMTNDEKDRHVLAAAVAVGAGAVVTFNVKHFDEAACGPHGVEAIHPDEFLMILHGISPEAVLEVMTEQAADLRKPAMTLDELLVSLERVVPMFAAAVRETATASATRGEESS